MDVKNLNHPNLNHQKLNPSTAWSDLLGRAKATKQGDFMGVNVPKSLVNAKMSELPVKTSRDAFVQALDKATNNRAPLDEEKTAQLEKSSATLVNQFFMGTMLKQMRQSPFKVESLSGGKGGDAYAGLFDQNIAEHAGNRIAKSLVKSMVKQYARTAAGVGALS